MMDNPFHTDQFISHSADETFALGEGWGKTVQAGTLIGLVGELGSGKTQLVKGIARGLGISRRVSSPTFALVNEYEEGRVPLAHLDLYRLENARAVQRAGLDAYLMTPSSVVVVEWIDRWFGSGQPGPGLRFSPSGVWLVRLLVLDENIRLISYRDR